MKGVIRIFFCSGDCSRAASQVMHRFTPIFAETLLPLPDPAGVNGLTIALSFYNPLMQREKEDRRPYFSRATGEYWLSAELEYGDWVEPDWDRRLRSIVNAIGKALGSSEKSRLPGETGAAVEQAAQACRLRLLQEPPVELVLLDPVQIVLDGEKIVSVGAASSGGFRPPDGLVLAPSEVAAALSRYTRGTSPPEIFKLYRLDDAGHRYREAWLESDCVVEHWGLCGDEGETRRVPVRDAAEGHRTLARLKALGRREGYGVIPLDRHATIVLERSIDGLGGPDDLDIRHDLEAYLDQLLGWTGLGHCDGGSSGSGSMEVFCLVVDARAAIDTIERAVRGTRFSRFRARLWNPKHADADGQTL